MTDSRSSTGGFPLTCPSCSCLLEEVSPGHLTCASDGTSIHRRDGIWRFSPLEADLETGRFIEDYERLRKNEAWGSDDPDYFRSLPFKDISGRHEAIWRIRAASFEVLSEKVLSGSTGLTEPARIVDLGAGNCWLSWRLGAAGHKVAAVDLSTDSRDGLGAARHYEETPPFLRLQTSFDHLPLASGSVDIAIFNGSVHYAGDYRKTLEEAKRVLSPDGRIVIMDSPVYRWERSGRGMLEERKRAWRKEYGADFGAQRQESYLTPRRLSRLREELGLRWARHRLPLGWSWHLRPFLEVLRGRREVARFPVLVGEASRAGQIS